VRWLVGLLWLNGILSTKIAILPKSPSKNLLFVVGLTLALTSVANHHAMTINGNYLASHQI